MSSSLFVALRRVEADVESARSQNQQESCKSNLSSSLYIFKMLCGLIATFQLFQDGSECDSIDSNVWTSDSPRIPLSGVLHQSHTEARYTIAITSPKVLGEF